MASQDNLEKSLSDTLVRDVMTKALITVEPATTVYQIAKLMDHGGVGAILVKKDGIPAGIITDRDFAIKIAAQDYSMETLVEKVASYPLQTISPTESILNAADMMSSKKIRKLAVLENDKIVGIITSTDLVNQLASRNNHSK